MTRAPENVSSIEFGRLSLDTNDCYKSNTFANTDAWGNPALSIWNGSHTAWDAGAIKSSGWPQPIVGKGPWTDPDEGKSLNSDEWRLNESTAATAINVGFLNESNDDTTKHISGPSMSTSRPSDLAWSEPDPPGTIAPEKPHSFESSTTVKVAATSAEPDINELINTTSNWGKVAVNQTTPWDTSSCSLAPVNAAAGAAPGTDCNVWASEPPNGTAIWDQHYDAIDKKTARWTGASAEPTTAAWQNTNVEPAQRPRHWPGMGLGRGGPGQAWGGVGQGKNAANFRPLLGAAVGSGTGATSRVSPSPGLANLPSAASVMMQQPPIPSTDFSRFGQLPAQSHQLMMPDVMDQYGGGMFEPPHGQRAGRMGGAAAAPGASLMGQKSRGRQPLDGGGFDGSKASALDPGMYDAAAAAMETFFFHAPPPHPHQPPAGAPWLPPGVPFVPGQPPPAGPPPGTPGGCQLADTASIVRRLGILSPNSAQANLLNEIDALCNKHSTIRNRIAQYSRINFPVAGANEPDVMQQLYFQMAQVEKQHSVKHAQLERELYTQRMNPAGRGFQSPVGHFNNYNNAPNGSGKPANRAIVGGLTSGMQGGGGNSSAGAGFGQQSAGGRFPPWCPPSGSPVGGGTGAPPGGPMLGSKPEEHWLEVYLTNEDHQMTYISELAKSFGVIALRQLSTELGPTCLLLAFEGVEQAMSAMHFLNSHKFPVRSLPEKEAHARMMNYN